MQYVVHSKLLYPLGRDFFVPTWERSGLRERFFDLIRAIKLWAERAKIARESAFFRSLRWNVLCITQKNRSRVTWSLTLSHNNALSLSLSGWDTMWIYHLKPRYEAMWETTWQTKTARSLALRYQILSERPKFVSQRERCVYSVEFRFHRVQYFLFFWNKPSSNETVLVYRVSVLFALLKQAKLRRNLTLVLLSF